MFPINLRSFTSSKPTSKSKYFLLKKDFHNFVEIFFFVTTPKHRERLIQEDFLDDRWKMMVACILLNQTNNKQVRPILDNLFSLIPGPEKAISTRPEDIAEIIKSTGFQNVKAERIIKLSRKWIDGFIDPSELPGIGKYGKDSWEIFVNQNHRIDTQDKKLKMYLSAIGEPK